jgi:glycogen debranching enzyme
MNMKNLLAFGLLWLSSFSVVAQSISLFFDTSESLVGKDKYLNSPYATAGDRLYMVGHQDGTFPDLGWHIAGEMGGVWAHPIKLMDGFEITVKNKTQSQLLTRASSFVNAPFGNKVVYENVFSDLRITRLQFVPDGKRAVFVELLIENQSDASQDIDLELIGISNLRPTWLGEQTNMVDGADQSVFNKRLGVVEVKDSNNPWFLSYGFGNGTSFIKSEGSKKGKPLSKIDKIGKSLTVPANGIVSIPFVISGSLKLQSDANAVFRNTLKKGYFLLKEKSARYNSIEDNSKLTLSDKELEQAFRWVKYNTDWLIRDVEGQGRGLSAGLPDYPWWFGVDNEYTLKGLIATGQKDLVYQTIELIHNFSKKENGNGRIVHEVSTNGVVFNPGNLNETPQFTSLVWEVFRWTGDLKFLEAYFPTIEMGLSWLLEENDADKNLIPDGFGMMEIHGLNSEMIDVAAYTAKAFDDASKMAILLKKDTLSKFYQNRASILKQKINTEFWVEEFNSYADFLGTNKQALELIDAAIVRADTLNKPWAVKELVQTKNKILASAENKKQGYVLYHNWVVNTPMEMQIAEPKKALKALVTAQNFTSPFGMFVTGIDRDEAAGKDEGSFAADKKIFSYTGAVMTLPTGVQAVAENNYGRPNEAYALLKRMCKSFGYALPGSIYEVSPDFGMFAQAWNMYAFGVPLITQFLGINPDAYHEQVTFSPVLPDALENGSLKNVVVGKNIFELSFENSGTTLTYSIIQKGSFDLTFKQPAGKYTDWEINGKPVKPIVVDGVEMVSFKGKVNTLRLKK